jgi:hypothetical protein
MSTNGVDIAFTICMRKWRDIYRVALVANMDGWKNEKKQQLKIITETCEIAFLISSLNALYRISLLTKLIWPHK